MNFFQRIQIYVLQHNVGFGTVITNMNISAIVEGFKIYKVPIALREIFMDRIGIILNTYLEVQAKGKE